MGSREEVGDGGSGVRERWRWGKGGGLLGERATPKVRIDVEIRAGKTIVAVTGLDR